MTVIRFGTDGWRARMGRDFTFANIRLALQGYANHLKKKQRKESLAILVNYDTRYLSREFASEAAKVLSLNKIYVHLPPRDTPLPAVSLAITTRQLDGAITFTASFDELIFNGIKVFNRNGAPALPSQTILIESEIKALAPHFTFKPRYADDHFILNSDVKPAYLEYIQGKVNLQKIAAARVRIIVDCLYGTSRDYLDKLLIESGCEVSAIHNYTDPYFGGVIPTCNRNNLSELARVVLEKEAALGLATDIDADRFGIIDDRGRFLDSNTIIPPLCEYLIRERGMRGDIVKSVATTEQVNQVAASNHRRVYETPVGFKYLADALLNRPAFLGVESTNGASLGGPIPVKDGILFNLLVAEMVAHCQCRMEAILNDFHQRYPRLYHREIQFAKTEARASQFRRLLGGDLHCLAQAKPSRVDTLDGIKLIYPDSWLLIRESGTKNIFRIYAESPSLKKTRELLHLGRKCLAAE